MTMTKKRIFVLSLLIAIVIGLYVQIPVSASNGLQLLTPFVAINTMGEKVICEQGEETDITYRVTFIYYENDGDTKGFVDPTWPITVQWYRSKGPYSNYDRSEPCASNTETYSASGYIVYETSITPNTNILGESAYYAVISYGAYEINPTKSATIQTETISELWFATIKSHDGSYEANVELPIYSVTADESGVTANIGYGNGHAYKIAYIVYKDYAKVCEGTNNCFILNETGDVRLSVPVDNLWPDTYRLVVYGLDQTLKNAGPMYTFDITMGTCGTRNINQKTVTVLAPPDAQSRLITCKAPYANVYVGPDMRKVSGSIKQYDRVYWAPTSNPLIYYIRAYSIPGQPEWTKEVESVGQYTGMYWSVKNTYESTGYVYAGALGRGDTSENIVEDAIKIAYKRLGVDGLYSQSKRWEYFWADCSSLVWWAYKEAGVAMRATTAESMALFLDSTSCVTYNVHKTREVMLDRDYYDSFGYSIVPVTYPETENMESEAFLELLQPGDLLFFNNKGPAYYIEEELEPIDMETIDFEIDPDDPTIVQDEDDPEAYYRIVIKHKLLSHAIQALEVDEDGNYYAGIDHVGLYIGNGKMIHASSVGFPPMTVIADLSLYNMQNVVFVGRPNLEQRVRTRSELMISALATNRKQLFEKLNIQTVGYSSLKDASRSVAFVKNLCLKIPNKIVWSLLPDTLTIHLIEKDSYVDYINSIYVGYGDISVGLYSSSSKDLYLEDDYMKFAFYHELGHYIQHTICGDDNQDIIDLYNNENELDGVCRNRRDDYARTSVFEFFAEAFDSYIQTPELLQTSAPLTYMYMYQLTER